jgi:hypothetical protein
MRAAVHNAQKLQEALEKAERQLTRRPEGAGAIVEMHPSEIQVRPELFQPREFSFGLHKTDEDHVKKLARAIGIQGELDPIVVIKLGKRFVCVDGHHRLEAYKSEKWTRTIRCEWFAGSVREAVDESVSRNAKDRLNFLQADRLEQAWKRVLLGWGSKAQIVQLFGVGDGTVAHMRRVMLRGREKSELGNEFRRQLGLSLMETSWAQAKLVYQGAEATEVDDELRAERLARRINSRLTNLLSRDPKVTARALELYDPKLPKGLTEAWGTPNPIAGIAEGDDAGEAYAGGGLSLGEGTLKRELEACRKRVGAIEAELARRASGGARSDHAWAEWVRKEPPG